MSPNFILELEMLLNSKTCYRNETAMEYGRHIYNSTLGFALKRYNTMKQSKKYRSLLKEYRKYKYAKSDVDKNAKAIISDKLSEMRKEYSLTKYQLEHYATTYKNNHNYGKYLDSSTILSIADQVWDSIEKLIFHKSKKVHFRKYGQFNSLEGKTNKQGIRFIKTSEKYQRSVSDMNMVFWNDMKMPVKIRNNDIYAQEVLENYNVKFCRIVRKFIKNKYKYYIQLTFDGIPPAKRNSDGSFRHKVSLGKDAGIDIGTTTIAACSEKKVSLEKLGTDDTDKLQKKISRLQSKLNRSSRSCDPGNYNADGTPKKGRLKWHRSKNYIKTLKRVKECHRLKAVKLKLSHRKRANKILECGTNVYVENMNYKGLAKKSKETKISEVTGKIKSKKRYGKSIGNCAPAMLLAIIDQKLNCLGLKLNKVNTRTFKASQYNHATDTYRKKKLSQRWSIIDGHKVQRDLYSAFLLMNSKSNLKNCDRELCINTFENFIKLHDIEIERLKSSSEILPSSFGIKKAC